MIHSRAGLVFLFFSFLFFQVLVGCDMLSLHGTALIGLERRKLPIIIDSGFPIPFSDMARARQRNLKYFNFVCLKPG